MSYIHLISKNHTIKINTNNIIKIKAVLFKYLSNIDNLLCLDFHGVTDLYNDNERIPSDMSKCVISYIGGNIVTVRNTTETIRKRIIGGEVRLGIIVYRKDDRPLCGTKGWMIMRLLEVNDKMIIYFIDDSRRNVKCVDNVGSSRVKSYYVDKRNDPKGYLTRLLDKL